MVFGAVVALHVVAVSLYLAHSDEYGRAIAGLGPICYLLGLRHAFDADHIAAIDDTTRILTQRDSQRPVGVGFFFAVGHSSVVVLLALTVTTFAGGALTGDVTSLAPAGVLVATSVAGLFLTFVAALNAILFARLVKLRRLARSGRITSQQLEASLLKGGTFSRLLPGRARSLIRSSWHMMPVGFLFGLGMETATEVTLLALSAGAAHGGELPVLAVLSLPLLFAAGMTACDTADGVLMMRSFAWAYRDPRRRLTYNTVTTGLTVAVAMFVASVYLAKLGNTLVSTSGLAAYSRLDHYFASMGPLIILAFVLLWALGAAAARGARQGREPTRPSTAVH
jgi:high-affinity nickel-transport protein